MRRAIAAIISTVAGLVLLLSFKSHAGNAGPGIGALVHHASPTPSASPRAKATKKPATQSSTRTLTGDTINTRYGPVQVRVTLSGSRLTDVSPVQLPQDSSRDIEIDNQAVPILLQEALSAQSANIDSVSGATYTSDGYIRSLQSALDKA
jgi:uncharacterized protein with FMN-binding domain